jgi:uncharacterized membrane protein
LIGEVGVERYLYYLKGMSYTYLTEVMFSYKCQSDTVNTLMQ